MAKLSPGRRRRSDIKKWLPVALWAGIIFFFSTEHFSAANTSGTLNSLLSWLLPGLTADQFESIHVAIRKLGHWSAYFVFAVLIMRALRDETTGSWKPRHLTWCLLIVFLWAAGDEFHQSLTPDRTSTFTDVMIDLFGGICGALWMVLRPQEKAP
jgi:VanZ family protein